MELVGNEKEIQTLFRELILADERVAPEFISVWNRAQATRPVPSRAFKISLAVATTLFVIVLSALVLWSRTGQRSEQANPGVATESTTPDSTPAPPAASSRSTLIVAAQPPVRVKSNRWDGRLAARRQAD